MHAKEHQVWVTFMVVGWGAASILQAATSNFAGLVALRCLMGAFEAGFAPGVALYLSFFYPRSEMGLRYGLFISFSAIANCFASALAYGIVHANTSIANWRLLFIIGTCRSFRSPGLESPNLVLSRGYSYDCDSASSLDVFASRAW